MGLSNSPRRKNSKLPVSSSSNSAMSGMNLSFFKASL